MTPTQAHLFKLLLEIDAICKKYDIEFYLDYGTALGAIRHEGFIPWDNDLDITIKEADYHKFREACQKELDGKTRAFVDNRLNREFPTVFGHYIDMEFARMSRFTNFWDGTCGQWIDIFCLIDIPGDKKVRRDFINRYYAYDELANRSFRHSRYKNSEMMRYYKQYKEKSFRFGMNAVLEELEEGIFGQEFGPTDQMMVTSARGLSPIPFVPKSAFETSRKVMFEGHEFLVGGDYVELMTQYYGDDWNLFPKDKHTHVEMSHTGIPTRVYVEDFMRLFNKPAFLERREQYKETCVEEGWQASQLYGEFCRAQSLKIRFLIEKAIKEENLDLRKMMEEGKPEDLKRLGELFEEFYNKQFDKSALTWRAHFEIGDEFEYAAMYTLLMYRNDMKKLDWMFWIREQNDLEPTPDMKHIQETVGHIRGIKKHMLYQEYDKAKEDLDWCLSQFPDSKEIRIWKLRYTAAIAGGQEELDQALFMADAYLEEFPDNDNCLKTKADLLWQQGRIEEAEEIFAALKEKTNDGLILLDIRKKEESVQHG